MKKANLSKVLALLLVCILSLGVLTACNAEEPTCEHAWVDATCESPKTCATCNETEGEALGHKGGLATCTEKAICATCNQPYGELKAHVAKADDNDCTTAVTCENCSYIFVPAAPSHTGGNATCTAKAECTRCGTAYGELAEHTPGDAATCTTAQTCTVCNTELVAAGHSWNDATCAAPKTCSVCTATDGEALGHSWNDATCTAPKTCSVCTATEGEALGPSWNDATCAAPKTCSVCSATEGEALEHDWNDATCEAPKTCSVCTATEGEALPHTPGAEATCSAPQICTVCNTVLATADHNYVNGACSVCGVALPKMETTTYVPNWVDKNYVALTADEGANGVEYALANDTTVKLYGANSRMLMASVNMAGAGYAVFEFPGMVNEITVAFTGKSNFLVYGLNSEGEWEQIGNKIWYSIITEKTMVGDIECLVFSIKAESSYQSIKIENVASSQGKIYSITVNPA